MARFNEAAARCRGKLERAERVGIPQAELQ